MDSKLERLHDFQAYTGLTNNAFATKCKINPSNYAKMLKGQLSFTQRSIALIRDAFPQLNSMWLLTGEGDMLLKSEYDDVSKERAIPFYEVETTGGYNGMVSSSDGSGEIVGYIQPGGWFDGRETAAIRHVGDSMVEYPNGCILAVREVTDIRLLVPGRNYVIETSEYRVTKRVQRGSTPHTIALYSSNEEKYDDGRLIHEPFEVEFEDIRRIFSVLGYIVNQSGEYRLIKP
ncbi:MAG: hypothetical protein K2J42_11365 [Muribaculaceae bacterium]|nr:hypothetical protein [Muribaculaceae bacterium]